ncbi:MAG: hypothetical protein LBK95_04770 [Bifidobacteriaceae bacterium]|nr:hypothetical protein [Bifidobacteriaceae bacterium]
MTKHGFSPVSRRRAARAAALLGIAASDALSAWIAYVPLEIMRNLYMQLMFSAKHGETYTDTPGLDAVTFAVGLTVALIPCVAGNLLLKRKAGINGRWLALAAAIIIPLPPVVYYCHYYLIAGS